MCFHTLFLESLKVKARLYGCASTFCSWNQWRPWPDCTNVFPPFDLEFSAHLGKTVWICFQTYFLESVKTLAIKTIQLCFHTLFLESVKALAMARLYECPSSVCSWNQWRSRHDCKDVLSYFVPGISEGPTKIVMMWFPSLILESGKLMQD